MFSVVMTVQQIEERHGSRLDRLLRILGDVHGNGMSINRRAEPGRCESPRSGVRYGCLEIACSSVLERRRILKVRVTGEA